MIYLWLNNDVENNILVELMKKQKTKKKILELK